MTTKSVVLKRGSITRSFDQWRDDDYDVLENGVVVGRIFCLDAVGPQGRPWMWASRPQRGNTAGSARIRADARSRDGRLREELEEVAMDTLERFPLVWCDTCE